MKKKPGGALFPPASARRSCLFLLLCATASCLLTGCAVKSCSPAEESAPSITLSEGVSLPPVKALAWLSSDISGEIFGEDFSEGNCFISLSEDGSVRIWDLYSGLISIMGKDGELSGFPGFEEGAGGASPPESSDGTKKITPAEDGGIILSEAGSGKELARYYGFPAASGRAAEWASISPSGFYNASFGGANFLEVKTSRRRYRLDQLSEALYRPDLFKAGLLSDSGEASDGRAGANTAASQIVTNRDSAAPGGIQSGGAGGITGGGTGGGATASRTAVDKGSTVHSSGAGGITGGSAVPGGVAGSPAGNSASSPGNSPGNSPPGGSPAGSKPGGSPGNRPPYSLPPGLRELLSDDYEPPLVSVFAGKDDLLKGELTIKLNVQKGGAGFVALYRFIDGEEIPVNFLETGSSNEITLKAAPGFIGISAFNKNNTVESARIWVELPESAGDGAAAGQGSIGAGAATSTAAGQPPDVAGPSAASTTAGRSADVAGLSAASRENTRTLNLLLAASAENAAELESYFSGQEDGELFTGVNVVKLGAGGANANDPESAPVNTSKAGAPETGDLKTAPANTSKAGAPLAGAPGATNPEGPKSGTGSGDVNVVYIEGRARMDPLGDLEINIAQRAEGAPEAGSAKARDLKAEKPNANALEAGSPKARDPQASDLQTNNLKAWDLIRLVHGLSGDTLLILDLNTDDSNDSLNTALLRLRYRLGPKAIFAASEGAASKNSANGNAASGGAANRNLANRNPASGSAANGNPANGSAASGGAANKNSASVNPASEGAANGSAVIHPLMKALGSGYGTRFISAADLLKRTAVAVKEEGSSYLAFYPARDFYLADPLINRGELKFQTMTSGMLKIDQVDAKPVPLVFGETLVRPLPPGNYIIDMIYRNGYRETRFASLKKKDSKWVVFTYTPALLTGSSLNALPFKGINIAEINPVNYEKINKEAMEGMGMAPFYVAFLAGEKCYREGNYKEAIAEYDRAISLNAAFTGAYVSRGNARRRAGDHDKAIEDYSKALSLKNNYAEVYNYRGYLYAQKGEYYRAIADYNQAIRFRADYADAYFNRAYALCKQQRWEEAIADYTQVIKLEPSNGAAYRERGNAYRSRGDEIKAAADHAAAEKLK